MIRYSLGRLLQTVPLLVFLSVLTFGMLAVAPGDPAVAVLQGTRGGGPPRPADIARVHHNLGLDNPVYERYLRWVSDAVRGDFGISYVKGRPVSQLLRDTVPPTLVLTGTALMLTVVLAVLLGLVAGCAPGSIAARSINAGVLGLYSAPGFLVGLLGVLIFSVYWHILPSGGMTRAGYPITVFEVARHVVLPAFALALGHHLGAYLRLVEAAVVETRTSDYVLNARARGLPRRTVLLHHVLRNSLGPFVAQLGASFGSLIAGAYAIEVIFAWPGMGRAGLQAATGRDYSVLMAIVLLTGVAAVMGNLLADLVAALLDPRIRLTNRSRATSSVELSMEPTSALPA